MTLFQQIALNQKYEQGYVSEETKKMVQMEADRISLQRHMDLVQGVHGGHLYDDNIHYSRKLGAGRYGSKR